MGEAIIGEIGARKTKQLEAIVTDAANKVAGYTLADDYYEGRHRILLTDRARKYLEASGQPYALNFCERIVEAVEDKLIIDGVTVKVTFADDQAQTTAPSIAAEGQLPTAATRPKAATPADQGSQESDDEIDAGKKLTAWLEQYCDLIGFDEIAAVVHHDFACKGDGYAQPYYDHDNERPEVTWEAPENCVPYYRKGKPHQLECIAKTWNDTVIGEDGITEIEQTRVNIYYDDRIEKYVRANSAQWLAWWDDADGFDEVIDSASVSEDGETYDTIAVPRWPVPWLRAAEPDQPADARGIGFGHFRNKSSGKRYGTSELANVFPQQDAINKRMIDLDLVNDNQGYSQRWASGITAGSKLLTHPGAVWSTTAKEAKFGQFPAGDPTGIIRTIETQVQHLAGTTATPLHQLLIIGTPPSGEALKTAEGPFVSKLERKQKSLGRVWSQVLLQILQMALDHQLVVIDGLDSATITIEVHWKSPETRNDKEHWETQLLKQSAGVSQATTLEEDGYPFDREQDRRAAETTARTAALTASINRGGEFGEVPQ